MLRVGKIEFHPSRQPDKFLASCSIEFLDGEQSILTIHDFVVGRSKWDNGRLYAGVPMSFYKTTTGLQIERSCEFDPRFWRELSQLIVAAYEQQERGSGGTK